MGGGVHEGLAPQMKRDGIPLPDNLAEQPVLAQNLIVYLDAFYELDTERPAGTVPGPIPWGKIIQYGQHYGFDEQELLFFIRKMDEAHLQRLRKGSTDGGSSGPGTVVQRPPRPD